jgi:hypothetical protein
LADELRAVCQRPLNQFLFLLVHLGCELKHEIEGLLLLSAVLFGDCEVEGSVVIVADGVADFAADALAFEVVD